MNKPLRKSHIAPEFMYQPMYDSIHRFGAYGRKAEEIPQIYQKGLREKLLCNDCEQLLANGYENYAATAFYKPALEKVKRKPINFSISGLDYHKFKLFLISLLWRFGNVTDNVFRPAHLGPHSEKLRKMLLQDDAGDWLDYPCLVTALTLRGKFYGDFMAGAFSSKACGISVWAFVLSGFLFNFFVGSHCPPQFLHPLFLKPSGDLNIDVCELRENESLYQFVSDIGNAQRERRAKLKTKG